MLSIIEENVRERSMSYPKYKLYKVRFYILFLFSFLSFNQCLIWSTFSPIYESAQKYYNISESTLDLFLSWGPILFLPFLPLTYILLNLNNGLRYCVILLSIIELISTIIRIIPSIIISLTNSNIHSLSLPFLHLGQILNAICGPLAMAPVSQLSCLWFGTNERTRATTIAIMAYNLGSTISFPLGPSIVSSPEDIPHLLYIHVAFAFIGCLLTLIYFPSKPPTPPTPAAELLIKKPLNKQRNKSCQNFFKNLYNCFSTRSFVFLVISFGLIGGTFEVWTNLIDVILTPENYTEKQIGWFGFSSSVSEIIGGLIIATIADIPKFNRSFKILILICSICYFISMLWFNLSIHQIFIDKIIIPSSKMTIGIACTLSGLFQGGALPLAYESLAEIMYPLPESLSASILVQFINVASLILFFIAPSRYKILNLIMLIIIFLSIILISLTKFNYKRRDDDRIKRRTLVSSDFDLIDNNNQISTITTYSPNDDLEIDAVQMDPLHDITDTKPIIE